MEVFQLAEKVVVDPHAGYKKELRRQARGKTIEEKLDIFVRAAHEAKSDEDTWAGRKNFARGEVEKLLRKAKRSRFATSDGELEASFGPYLTINNREEAERFRRFVTRHLGTEKGRGAVAEEHVFRADPEVVKELERRGLKEPYCRRCGKMRLSIRPKTGATERGER